MEIHLSCMSCLSFLAEQNSSTMGLLLTSPTMFKHSWMAISLKDWLEEGSPFVTDHQTLCHQIFSCQDLSNHMYIILVHNLTECINSLQHMESGRILVAPLPKAMLKFMGRKKNSQFLYLGKCVSPVNSYKFRSYNHFFYYIYKRNTL